MLVSDVLDEKGEAVVTVRATDSLKTAMALLNRERIGAALVVNAEGQVVGMLSERDLVMVLAEYGPLAFKANVGALMSKHVYICTPDDRVQDAMSWMVHYRVRHLPVVRDGAVIGLISIGDVVKQLLDDEARPPALLEGTVVVSGGREGM